MLTNAAKMCHWTENFCNVPEGMNLGTPVLLLPFELVEYYKIYNNDGAGGTVTVADERELEDALLEDGDAEALALALKVCRAQSPQRSMQLDKMLAQPRSLTWVSQFAAYSCQMASLRLKPHEVPPCHVNNPKTLKEEERDGAKLQRKMRRHGVSKWHPMPMDAIAAAQDTAQGPRFTKLAVALFKMASRGHDVRAEIHAALGLGPQHPNVLDIDILGDPPAGLTGAALADWKLAHRLLSQLICGE